MNPRLLSMRPHSFYSRYWTHYDVLRRTYVRRLTFDDLLKGSKT